MTVERRLSPLFTWRSAVASGDSGLSATQRHVALTLSLHMSEKGDSCFPGMPLLVDETGLGQSTVRDALRQLHDQGWIIREINAGRNHTNRYTATIPNRQQPAVSYPQGSVGAEDENRQLEAENRQMEAGKPPGAGAKDVKEGDKESEGAAAAARALLKSLDDALREVCLGRVGVKIPTRQARQFGIAATELAKIGATPADVRAAAGAYRRDTTLRECLLTPMAMVNQWGQIAPRGNGASSACPSCGVGQGLHTEDCNLSESRTPREDPTEGQVA